MSEQEFINLCRNIEKCLQEGHEDFLRKKAALGLDVVVADDNGMPISVPASVLLAKDEIK